MLKKFTRTVEDFVCGHCGRLVHGDGYTNHCPHCLWSRHVDINPGDRQAACKGLMEPLAVTQSGQRLMLEHCCQCCGFKRRNKVQRSDDFNKLLALGGR